MHGDKFISGENLYAFNKIANAESEYCEFDDFYVIN
jgi:hypothetical protein